MQVPLRPFPLDVAAGDSLETFLASGRTWQGTLDPSQNGTATAVLGRPGGADKGKAVSGRLERLGAPSKC